MQLVPPSSGPKKFPADTFPSMYSVKHWIPSTDATTNRKSKEQLQAG
jgi:hypothetical protein